MSHQVLPPKSNHFPLTRRNRATRFGRSDLKMGKKKISEYLASQIRDNLLSSLGINCLKGPKVTENFENLYIVTKPVQLASRILEEKNKGVTKQDENSP